MEREYKNTNSILSERMSYNCTNDCNAFCNIQPVNSLSNLSFQFFASFRIRIKMLNSKFYISIKLPAQWAVSITIGCTAAGSTRCRLRIFVMLYLNHQCIISIFLFYHHVFFDTIENIHKIHIFYLSNI